MLARPADLRIVPKKNAIRRVSTRRRTRKGSRTVNGHPSTLTEDLLGEVPNVLAETEKLTPIRFSVVAAGKAPGSASWMPAN